MTNFAESESGATEQRFSTISTVPQLMNQTSLTQLVPECFKPALPQVRKLTSEADYEGFIANAVKVSDLVPNSANADVYVQSHT